eukprot:m.73512 g.73512  ORF g.73512 m.73512 type:complete len:69 (+) comp8843_c0_seq1:2-208(+)
MTIMLPCRGMGFDLNILVGVALCGLADSSYCNTGPSFGNRTPVVDTWGACILGWAGGVSTKQCASGLG